jgi:predicted MFS family arabinose efflux permease
MLAGLVILTTGTLFVALAPSFGAVLVAVAFLSLCKAVYDPAVLAYLGDEVPYERRGRMMGLLALMWPLAWLVGVPLTGYLIDRVNWRAPFWMIFLLGMVSLGLALHYRTLGAGKTRHLRQAEIQGWEPFAHKLRMQVQAIPRSGWLALMVTLLMIMASENIYMVYGAWLEDEFSLSLTALGAFSIVISAAEISAESISTLWVDRIGKRKAVIIGLTLNGMAYLLLPQLAGSLAGALTGLFLVYITFDFSIVSALPLISELAPEKRGTLMALNVSAMAAGRLLSSLSAIKFWTAGGLAANAASSAFAVFIALVILIGLVRERKLETQPATS